MSNDINKRIAKYRKLAGMTQNDAAQNLDMKRNTYARMELNGNPKPELLKKISALYNISVEELLYGNPIDNTRLYLRSGKLLLNQDSAEFFEDSAFIPTSKEQKILKIIRNLPKESKEKVLQFIEKEYKDSKNP